MHARNAMEEDNNEHQSAYAEMRSKIKSMQTSSRDLRA